MFFVFGRCFLFAQKKPNVQCDSESGLHRNRLAFFLLFLQSLMVAMLSAISTNRQQCKIFLLNFEVISFSLSLFHRCNNCHAMRPPHFFFSHLFTSCFFVCMCTTVRKWPYDWLDHFASFSICFGSIWTSRRWLLFFDYNIWFSSAQTNKTHLNLLWMCVLL